MNCALRLLLTTICLFTLIHPLVAQPPVAGSLPTLTDGKFGKALDARATPVMIDAEPAYRQTPITLECWVRLPNAQFVNTIASCDTRQSAQHWALRSESGTGKIELHLPGYTPELISGSKIIADGQWHAAAFTFDGSLVRLYVDGQPAGETKVTRHQKLTPQPGNFCIGMAIDGKSRVTCNGLIDDVRLSRTIREISKLPTEPSVMDPLTVGLWSFDKVDQLAGDPAWTPRPASGTFPDWEKAAEKSWVDGRIREMNTGPSFNGTFQYPSWKGNEFVYKGTALRLGDKGEAAVLFDRCQLRYACGWTGDYLFHKDTRFGLMNTPKPAGTIAFATSPIPGWGNKDGKLEPVPARTIALPEDWGRFLGLHLHDNRPVLEYEIGGVRVLDAPWCDNYDGHPVFTRKIECRGKTAGMKLLLGEVTGTSFRVMDIPGDAKRLPSISPCQLMVAEREGIVTVLSFPYPINKDGKPSKVSQEGGRLYMELPAFDEGIELEVTTWVGKKEQLTSFAKAIVRYPPLPLNKPLLQPGGKRWGAPLVTTGEVAPNDKPLVVDTLTIPYENRFKALFFCTGVDALPNGDLAICTAHGDVWLIKGVDTSLKYLRWHRFATGLYNPLGLKVIDGQVYVLERGQLTRLHDLNGDGEADYMECITCNWHTGPGEHSYDSNLEADSHGNFYFFKTGDAQLPHGGTLLTCQKDGSQVRVYCTGFRHPMALSISPRDQVTGSDQEGNWIPSTRIDYFQPGGFYGFMPGHHRATQPTVYDPPICWVPRSLCNSAGGHSWVPEGTWGPLGGQLLHLSFGRCRISYVLPTQKVGDILQSGAIDIGVKFLSGIFRGRFHPIDHHFYACGLNGWQTAAARDGCLQRVRQTDKPLLLPLELTAHRNGLLVKFSQPLNADTANDASRYGFSQWNYRYSGDYGSKFWSVTEPKREGTDTLKVTKATLQPDGQTVLVEIANLRPAMQCQLTFDLKTKAGDAMNGDLYHTIHQLAEVRK